MASVIDELRHEVDNLLGRAEAEGRDLSASELLVLDQLRGEIVAAQITAEALGKSA